METRLVFCWSPGRCGTKYLTRLFETVPGVVAKHEPPPRFSECKGSKRMFWALEKIPAVMALGVPVYVETSHCFVLGFLEPLVELGYKPDVIQIQRKHRDVALSYWRRRSIPGRTRRGREFLLQPTFDGWEQLTDYQLCYWHALEVDRLAHTAREQVDRWHTVDFDNLIGGSGFLELVESMGLPAPVQAYERRRHEIANANPANYYRHFPKGDLNRLEAEVVTVSLG